MNPALIAAGIQTAGTLAGALAGRKKTPKAPDYSGLTAQVDASTAERKRLAGNTRTELAPINQNFGNQAHDLTSALLSKTKAAGSEYLDQASNAASLRSR